MGLRRAVLPAPLALALAHLACAGDSGESRGDSAASATITAANTNTSLPPGSISASATDSESDSDGSGSATDGGTGQSAASESEGASASDPTAATTSTTDDPTTTSTSTTTTGDPTTTTTGDPTGGGGNCDTILFATVRDFSAAHPDFESYTGDNAYTGLVKPDLGANKKPVYAHPGATPQTSGPAEFAHWYNDTPGINVPFEIQLPLTETMPGVYTFNDPMFFPINGQGFGNEGNFANFHFTTEIHATFTYKGGEVFKFTGDDDLWAFINNKLAIDLGGLHPPLSQTADLDALAPYLGIVKGGTYAMDIFHAERHTDQSNFRIDTSIQCFVPQ